MGVGGVMASPIGFRGWGGGGVMASPIGFRGWGGGGGNGLSYRI